MATLIAAVIADGHAVACAKAERLLQLYGAESFGMGAGRLRHDFSITTLNRFFAGHSFGYDESPLAGWRKIAEERARYEVT